MMDENEKLNQENPKTSSVPDPPAIQAPVEKAAPVKAATEQELRATEQKIEKQIDERMTAFERSMIRLTRYGLAVTILTGIIFAGQLYEMYTGGTATDRLVDYAKMQADAGNSISDAARQFSDTAEDTDANISDAVEQLKATAKNTRDSISETRNAMHADQRSWVIPFGSVECCTENKPALGNGGYTISGRTPISQIVVNAALERVMNGTSPSLNWKLLHSQSTISTLFPNTPIPSFQVPWFDIPLGKLPPEMPYPKGTLMTKQLIEDYNAGKFFFVFFERIDYQDAFGTKHWSQYCNWAYSSLAPVPSFTARKCTEFGGTDHH
jgi:hypothetical protein